MRLECINSIVHESQSVTNWVRHKRHLVIALGLNKHCSLINYKLFNRLRHYITPPKLPPKSSSKGKETTTNGPTIQM